MRPTRRAILGGMAASVAALNFPRVSFAGASGEKRFVLILMRGGLDGLAAVPPVGDENYRSLRGSLAFRERDVLGLDQGFGLHPSLRNLHGLYQQRQLAVFHAVASPYRERSHFDGQDILETGGTSVWAARDGWLNRALGGLAASNDPTERRAISVSQSMPLILHGDQPADNWSPPTLPEADDGFIARVQRLYAQDTVLHEALEQGLQIRSMAQEAMMGSEANGNSFVQAMRPAGAMLGAETGPRIGVIETSGWDTHANQGKRTGRLANLLGNLDEGVGALKEELGPAWRDTLVLAVTEFGRTAAPNGTGGTDHGTASISFAFGGAVQGGRVIADWPGLAARDLYENRDLAPTMDMRRLFKAALIDHLGLSRDFVNGQVFPGSEQTRAFEGLIRS